MHSTKHKIGNFCWVSKIKRSKIWAFHIIIMPLAFYLRGEEGLLERVNNRGVCYFRWLRAPVLDGRKTFYEYFLGQAVDVPP